MRNRRPTQVRIEGMGAVLDRFAAVLVVEAAQALRGLLDGSTEGTHVLLHVAAFLGGHLVASFPLLFECHCISEHTGIVAANSCEVVHVLVDIHGSALRCRGRGLFLG